MYTLVERAYLGRDNSIDLLLKADDVAVDLSSVTRMVLVVDSTTIISSTNQAADPILWNQVGYETGECRLFLKDQTLTTGRNTAQLVVYDPTNTDGVVWGSVVLLVHAETVIA